MKTKCMVIGSRHKLKSASKLDLRIDDILLENVTFQKILDVYIGITLNWHTQIDYVCKKLNIKIALLKRIIYYLTDEMKTMFYNAYILPIFDYCCTIWGKNNKTYINKINRLQKRVAKIILNKPSRSPTIGLFNQLNWLSFNDRCKYHTSILVFKVKSNMAPTYMSDIMTFSSNETHNLRSSKRNDLIMHSKPRTHYFKD